MAEVFPHHCLSVVILVIFRGKWLVKVGPKVQTLDASLFHKNSSRSNFFKQCICFLEYYSGDKFGNIEPYLGE